VRSMNEKLLDILKPQGECISEEMLIRYSKGDLSSAEARRVEEHLTECEFCSDALDGIMKSGNVQHYHARVSSAKHLLRKRLRVDEEKTTFPFTRALAIAATVLLLVFSAWFVEYLNSNSTQKIFSDQFKPYPPVSADSFSQSLAPVINEVGSSEQSSKISANNKEEMNSKRETASEKKDANEIKKSAPQVAKDISVPAPTNAEGTSPQEISEAQNKKAADDEPATPPAVNNSVSNFSVPKARVTEKEIANESDYSFRKNPEQDVINNHLQSGMDAYRHANYEKALTEFQSVLKEDARNEAASFYSGVCALALNNADEALDFFTKTDNKSSRYYEATLWYQSLSYLKKNDKKEAKNLLEKVVKQNGEHKSQAEQLLQDL